MKQNNSACLISAVHHQYKKAAIICLCGMVLSACSHQPVLDDSLLRIPSLTPAKQNVEWSKGWWEGRHQQKLNEAQKRDIDLLMLGDSITQGWEEAGQRVWQQYYQQRKAFNLGFNGDRTEHVLWRLQNGAVDQMQPKLVVLMIGTNNTGHRMDPVAHTAAGVKAIIHELQQRLPLSKILLLGIFPRSASPFNDMRRRNNAINQTIANYADNQHVHYLNINDVFLDDKKVLHPSIMPDMLHPSTLGYQKWAEAIEFKVNRLMQE